MVFSNMGAMLMSEEVKDWNPNIYPHLVKTMDSHYIAIGIACKAQQYVDRGVKMDSTTSHDTAYYACRPRRSSRINRRTEPKQPPRSINALSTVQLQQTAVIIIRRTECTNATQNPPYAGTILGASLALTDAHIVTQLLLRLRLRHISQLRMRIHHVQASCLLVFITRNKRIHHVQTSRNKDFRYEQDEM